MMVEKDKSPVAISYDNENEVAFKKPYLKKRLPSTFGQIKPDLTRIVNKFQQRP